MNPKFWNFQAEQQIREAAVAAEFPVRPLPSAPAASGNQPERSVRSTNESLGATPESVSGPEPARDPSLNPTQQKLAEDDKQLLGAVAFAEVHPGREYSKEPAWEQARWRKAAVQVLMHYRRAALGAPQK